jgi:hypothetical protein
LKPNKWNNRAPTVKKWLNLLHVTIALEKNHLHDQKCDLIEKKQFEKDTGSINPQDIL